MNSLVVLAVVLVVATVTVINAETTATTEVVPLVEETTVDPAALVQAQRNNGRERLTRGLQRRLERLLSMRAKFLRNVDRKIAETNAALARGLQRRLERLLSMRAKFLRNVDRKIAVTNAALANLDELVNNLITLPNQRQLRLSTVLGLAADLDASNPKATDVSRRRRGVETDASPDDVSEDEDDDIDELEEEMVDIMSEVELKADE